MSLEDLQNEVYEREKAAKKKMNATNARALNTFRQRIRKNNREYEDEIKKYREDPTVFDTESEEETKPEEREVRDEVLGPDGQIFRGFLAPEEDNEGYAVVGRGGRAIVYTADGIFKNLKMISEARGKRSTDRGEQIKILEKLKEVAATTYQKIRVLLALISARFDYNPIALYMPIDQWTAYVVFWVKLILVHKMKWSCFFKFSKLIVRGLSLRIRKIFHMMILHRILNRVRSSKSVGRSCLSSTDWMMNSPKVCKTLILIQLNISNDFAMNRICTLL